MKISQNGLYALQAVMTLARRYEEGAGSQLIELTADKRQSGLRVMVTVIM